MKKLYYEDSHIKAFTATVTGCAPADNGYAVTLDATAFYPEGGGQACDIGYLGESTVFAVKEVGEEVIHYCDKPQEVGATVAGAIDWDRRFDLMQQHAGEHVVSGIIFQTYGYHNVGFHIGADVVTIDFDGPIPAEDLPKIEDRANAAIWQNLPVKCYYPTREELPKVNYRRKKDLPWPVRIVEIPGIDTCACCGAQVQKTGEVGLVKLLSCVKFHQGVRIEMACGKRATDILRLIFDQNRQVSQAFSAQITETGVAARRMNETLGAEKFRSASLEKRLFAYIADGYAGKKLAVHFEKDLAPNANRELCNAIAGVCSVAVTLSGSDETGYSLCVISREADAKAVGANLIATLGGRGGGKRDAFQGTTSATRQAIEKYFQDCANRA
ncbi:MAG: alanyl-tRNA editing protein [Oscillospiraceae bacterium]|nr:alanyl-tRNA editing protein [Oscillospiraceae bacterium]